VAGDTVGREPGRHLLASDRPLEVVAEVLPVGSSLETEQRDAHDTVYVVLSGEGTILTDSDLRQVRAGSVVLVPHGQLFEVVAGGEQPLRLVLVVTPPGGYLAPRDVNEDTALVTAALTRTSESS
jgi:mannose-6-phosphate isomerase-like protein (cupin superfamily)